jgi:hypothetical protein
MRHLGNFNRSINEQDLNREIENHLMLLGARFVHLHEWRQQDARAQVLQLRQIFLECHFFGFLIGANPPKPNGSETTERGSCV